MRKNPPGSNNPINPLYKVATLQLDRQDWTKDKARVIAKLQFKSSNDMRGEAQTRGGEPVTISFALAVHRAILEISFRFSQNFPPGASLSASQVAHLHPLIASRSTREKDTRTFSKRRSIGVAGATEANISVHGASASVKARAKGAIEFTKAEKSSVQVDGVFETTNIGVTCDGNTIHWSIDPRNPGATPSLTNPHSYLSGEVFQHSNGALMLGAFVLTRSKAKKAGPVDLSGVVRINSADLIIEGVRFQDAHGNHVHWKNLDQKTIQDASPTLAEKSGINMNSIHGRLMQQIIKKHLLSQGLRSEGPYVEICSAAV